MQNTVKKTKNKTNIGKLFEYEFTKQCEQLMTDEAGHKLVLTRLRDSETRFKDIDNPCDFILYYYPNAYYLELKASQGNRLNFKGRIRPNQWEGLLDYSFCKGTYAGILLWFYEYKETYFINIKLLEQMRQDGKKSISLDECRELAILFDGHTPRKYTKYDIINNLNKIKSSN